MLELNWDSLSIRRTYAKLCLFFKIAHHKTPQYLGQKYFTNAGSTRLTRMTATAEHRILEPRCRIVCYQSSYFPSSIKLWNMLPSSILQCESILSFKVNIRQHLKLSKNSSEKTLAYFSTGRLGRVLSQIRLGLSLLNYHLFEYNINDNPFCPKCGTEFETILHFFCDCPHYEDDRFLLRNNVNLLISCLPTYLTINIDVQNNSSFCKLLTNGIKLDESLCPVITDVLIDQVSGFNHQLYCQVVRFMYNSARFICPTA